MIATFLKNAAAGAIALAVASTAGAGEASIESAERLLRALEDAGRDIHRLQAKVRYTRVQRLQGDRQVRQGTLYYKAEPAQGGEDKPRNRAFAVYFDTLYVDRQKREDRQLWVFDGRWLIEKRPSQKQYIAREIAPPGASFDPLRLGEGPLPIPIGQRADEVLQRYDAELLEPTAGVDLEGGVAAYVANARQLRLVPKPSWKEEDDFREIRLWYGKDRLLPKLARTVDRQGDISLVQLVGVTVNPESFNRQGVFDISRPPEDAGWDVQIKERRGE